MMNCIILDDEPLALLKLSEYIRQIPFLTLEKACMETQEAQALLEEKNIDLLFTDIDMPGMNGIEFIRSLARPPMVIFTTAYPSFAIDGFKLNAVDYLLKPFEFEDCLRAAQKAQKMKELNQSFSKSNQSDYTETLFVKSDYKVVRINIESIKYIESMSEYVRIYIEGKEKPVITLNSLQKLEARLPPHFMRVHRSYIVNLQKITEISRLRIRFDDQKLIPIGDNYKEKVMNYIARYGML